MPKSPALRASTRTRGRVTRALPRKGRASSRAADAHVNVAARAGPSAAARRRNSSSSCARSRAAAIAAVSVGSGRRPASPTTSGRDEAEDATTGVPERHRLERAEGRSPRTGSDTRRRARPPSTASARRPRDSPRNGSRGACRDAARAPAKPCSPQPSVPARTRSGKSGRRSQIDSIAATRRGRFLRGSSVPSVQDVRAPRVRRGTA